MVSLEVIALVLTGLGLTASITYYAIILNNNEKSRKKDMIISRLQLKTEDYKRWMEVITQEWSTNEEWLAKYGPNTNMEAYISTQYIIQRYNTYGLLLREGIIEPKILLEFLSPPTVIRIWRKLEPLIIERRKNLNNPEQYSAFEYLYKETLKLYPDVRIWSEIKF